MRRREGAGSPWYSLAPGPREARLRQEAPVRAMGEPPGWDKRMPGPGLTLGKQLPVERAAAWLPAQDPDGAHSTASLAAKHQVSS